MAPANPGPPGKMVVKPEREILQGDTLSISCLPRWLSGLRHSAHRPERSVRGAGVQSPGRPVDFVFRFQGRMF